MTVAKTRGMVMGLILGVVFFLPVIAGPYLALGSRDLAFKLVLLVPAYIGLAVYAGLLIDFLLMRYTFDSEGIHVSTLFVRRTLRWSSIREVIAVRGRPDVNIMLGCGWPGLIRGFYNITGIGFTEFFGSSIDEGVIIVKDDDRRLALTPADQHFFLEAIHQHGGPQPTYIEADTLVEDEFADRIDRDPGYKSLLRFNMVLIAALIAYLAICFPGQGSIVLLFPGLAVAMFAFMIGVAGRMYQVMPVMSYIMLFLSAMVTVVFIVVSLVIITFGVG